eukprot:655545-Rhodomonas_salina.2
MRRGQGSAVAHASAGNGAPLPCRAQGITEEFSQGCSTSTVVAHAAQGQGASQKSARRHGKAGVAVVGTSRANHDSDLDTALALPP